MNHKSHITSFKGLNNLYSINSILNYELPDGRIYLHTALACQLRYYFIFRALTNAVCGKDAGLHPLEMCTVYNMTELGPDTVTMMNSQCLYSLKQWCKQL